MDRYQVWAFIDFMIAAYCASIGEVGWTVVFMGLMISQEIRGAQK